MSRLGAIPCLVSCLPQRLLHGNVKTFDVILKRMEDESRADELALERHNLVYFWFVLYRKNVSISVRFLYYIFCIIVTLLRRDSAVSWSLMMR